MKNLKKENGFISYTVDKGFTKNIAISVENGQVAVIAPWYLSQRKIDEIISNKSSWINQKLKEYNELNKLKKKNLNKKTLKVFGKNYNLKIVYKFIKNPVLYLENKTVKIELPYKYKNIDNSKIIDLVLKKFYKKLAEKEIEKVTKKNRQELGLAS